MKAEDESISHSSRKPYFIVKLYKRNLSLIYVYLVAFRKKLLAVFTLKIKDAFAFRFCHPNKPLFTFIFWILCIGLWTWKSLISIHFDLYSIIIIINSILESYQLVNQPTCLISVQIYYLFHPTDLQFIMSMLWFRVSNSENRHPSSKCISFIFYGIRFWIIYGIIHILMCSDLRYKTESNRQSSSAITAISCQIRFARN